MDIKGLTLSEVKKQKRLGLSNNKIDAYAPTYFKIFRANILSLMNFVLVPLMIVLYYFERYNDVLVFLTFVIVAVTINSFEEIRVKKRIDKLQDEFKRKVFVVRDSKEQEIPADEVVKGDIVKATEGEMIVADGEIIESYYLQLDESAITGESNFIKKSKKDEILSGSFIVTGNCYYKVKSIGDNNYLNKIGKQSLNIQKKRSKLERYGNGFITFFVSLSIVLSLIIFVSLTRANVAEVDIVLSITTIVTLVIPQTLLFLFSLNYIISVTKLSQKGILVQKKGSIDELAGIDTLCIDKTGTITSNAMEVVKIYDIKNKAFAETSADSRDDLNLIGEIIKSSANLVVGRNKTFDSVIKFFNKTKKLNIEEFDQVPFTSKNKYSVIQCKIDTEPNSLVMGAYSSLNRHINEKLKDDVEKVVHNIESEGKRALVILKFNKLIIQNDNDTNVENFHLDNELITTNIFIVEIEEKLNKGIKETLLEVMEQGIDIKVISGDSLKSVKKIIENLGLNMEAVDISQADLNSKGKKNYKKLVSNFSIFARSTPQDKLELIKALKKQGKKVAMVGDGINDVLAMKQADVSISMETGSKITRDVADIVLLKNDYKKIPNIFYEGDNIVFNLKLSTKIYTAKAFIALVLALYFAYIKMPIAIFPTTTLIFSFVGNTFPSYLVIFSRQKVTDQSEFVKDILASSIPTGIFTGLITLVLYSLIRNNLTRGEISTALVIGLLGMSMVYTFYLLYESGKLKDFRILTFGFIFGFIFGTFQTILPLSAINTTLDKSVTFGLILFAAIIIFLGVNKILKKNKLKYLIVLLFILFGIFFPSRTYYNASPVPIEFFPSILQLTALVAVAIVIIHKTFVEALRR